MAARFYQASASVALREAVAKAEVAVKMNKPYESLKILREKFDMESEILKSSN